MIRPCCVVLMLVLGGCASEQAPNGLQNTGERTGARLPEGYRLDGPIATPARTARVINASVRAVIEPLGTVPFDGLVLPLVSPDATRLVTQTGSTPTWGTVLGAPGAGPSLRTRLEVYDIAVAPPERVRLDVPIPPGVLLGRSCDALGFLVEEPLPDGSRRIGRCSWRTGAIEWLADDPGVVYAAGVLTSSGDLLASRREVDRQASALWSRRLGTIAQEESVAYVFPMPIGREGEVGAFALDAGGDNRITWWTYRSGAPVLRSRRRFLSEPDMIGAYQATDPFRGVAVSSDRALPGLLVFRPGAGRVVMYEPGRADFVALADRSIAGAWAPDEGGWAVLLTTPRGLMHQRLISREGVWEALPGATVLADAYVPRATRNPQRPFVLIGPGGEGVMRRLSLVGLSLLADEDASAPGAR